MGCWLGETGWLSVIVLSGVLALAGCAERSSEPAAQPASAGERDAAASESASAGAPPQPTPRTPEPAPQPPPAPTPPDRPPPDAPPTQPPPRPGTDYLVVLERYQADAPFATNAQLEPPRRLRVDTQNVKRLRITRQDVPLMRGGSLSLTIDGQGFEWNEKTPVLLLERSPAGAWAVARE